MVNIDDDALKLVVQNLEQLAKEMQNHSATLIPRIPSQAKWLEHYALRIKDTLKLLKTCPQAARELNA